MNPQGITHRVPLIGVTTPEQGLGTQAVHLPSSHYLTFAATGAGKLLTSAAHQLIGWPSDLVAITPKEDLCNLSLGRRTDPTIFRDVNLVRQYGRRLGVDPNGITKATRHLHRGRSINLDLGGSTAYDFSRYTFLSDIDLDRPGALARLMAVARGNFPDQKPNASGDPYWQNAPQGAYAAVMGHVRATETDPQKQTLIHATKRLLGVDPATGKSSPKLQEQLFLEMTQNPKLGGYIAAQGAELLTLGAKTLGPLMSTIGTGTRWMLSDPRIVEVLSGPSDFSLDDVGRGPHPLSVYVTPRRGDASTDAFLRMFLELAVLVFQERTWTPDRPVLLLADEVPSWGDQQVNTLRRALNVLRDKKIVCWIYAQSYAQLIDRLGKEGAAEMLSATTAQFFGVRDHVTAELIRDRLGKTTIVRPGCSKPEEVYVADTDAIYDELSPGSPLQYVFPYSSRPARLYRASYIDANTSEGLKVRGLNYPGHYDVGLPPFNSRFNPNP
jgi:type IV secretion system protein VirD4